MQYVLEVNSNESHKKSTKGDEKQGKNMKSEKDNHFSSSLKPCMRRRTKKPPFGTSWTTQLHVPQDGGEHVGTCSRHNRLKDDANQNINKSSTPLGPQLPRDTVIMFSELKLTNTSQGYLDLAIWISLQRNQLAVRWIRVPAAEWKFLVQSKKPAQYSNSRFCSMLDSASGFSASNHPLGHIGPTF
jgi:hypothetical protein